MQHIGSGIQAAIHQSKRFYRTQPRWADFFVSADTVKAGVGRNEEERVTPRQTFLIHDTIPFFFVLSSGLCPHPLFPGLSLLR